MTRQKARFRFVLLVVAVMLLASITGLIACAEQPTTAPTPVLTPVPTMAPTPAPDLAPVPPQQPEEDAVETIIPPGAPALPHTFWGHVKTDEGKPASGVQVTAFIKGKPQEESITTDASGKYGGDLLIEYPDALSVTGYGGDIIEFRVDGVIAEETKLGVLIEVEGGYQWQWQDLEPEWQVIYVAGEHNGLDLVYTPAK